MNARSSGRRPPSWPEGCRGFTLLELVVATAMLLVAMTLTLHLIGWVAAERRAAERRSLATQEVANLMERLTAAAPAELEPRRLATLRLSPQAQRTLPGGALSVRVEEAGAGLSRIRVELRWRDRSGGTAAPVRLTSWIAVQRRTRP